MRWIIRRIYFLKVFSSLSFLKMANNTVTASSIPSVQRVLNVSGDIEKRNDLILCSACSGQVNKAVIFFGGDVQNYPEIMKQHRTNNIFIDWNLETTARILANKFPCSLVIVVKPKEMLLNTFSIYSNFVEFDVDGFPSLFTSTGALNHITKLYSNAVKEFNSKQYNGMKENTITSKETCSSVEDKTVCEDLSNDKSDVSHITKCEEDIPISLVGFSKGCVPLNQLMFEIATTSELMPPETLDFVSKIESVYWLDGGHNGRKDTWITSDFVLQKIAASKIQLFVHTTPYQIKDPNRPWIGKEQKKFVQKLKSYSANIHETRHYFDEPGSLERHFTILKDFK